MNVKEIRAQLWANVYADCLQRQMLWFEAKKQADLAVNCFDRCNFEPAAFVAIS